MFREHNGLVRVKSLREHQNRVNFVAPAARTPIAAKMCSRPDIKLEWKARPRRRCEKSTVTSRASNVSKIDIRKNS